MKCFWEQRPPQRPPVKPGLKFLAASLSVFLLWGCSTPDPLVVGADLVSLINTDKTITDHVVGWVTAKDCSSIRFSKGETYCLPEDNEEEAKEEQGLYCYRHLGGVSCYREPLKNTSSRTTVYPSKAPRKKAVKGQKFL